MSGLSSHHDNTELEAPLSNTISPIITLTLSSPHRRLSLILLIMSETRTVKKSQTADTANPVQSDKECRHHLSLSDLTPVQSESKTLTGMMPTATVHRKSCCPYHGSVIQLVNSSVGRTSGYAGLDRFLRENSYQQPAAFLRPDNGFFSLAKDCTCGQRSDQNASKL